MHRGVGPCHWLDMGVLGGGGSCLSVPRAARRAILSLWEGGNAPRCSPLREKRDESGSRRPSGSAAQQTVGKVLTVNRGFAPTDFKVGLFLRNGLGFVEDFPLKRESPCTQSGRLKQSSQNNALDVRIQPEHRTTCSESQPHRHSAARVFTQSSVSRAGIFRVLEPSEIALAVSGTPRYMGYGWIYRTRSRP